MYSISLSIHRTIALTGMLVLGPALAGAQGLLGFDVNLQTAVLPAPTPAPTAAPSAGTIHLQKAFTVSAGKRSEENLRGWSLGYRASILDTSRKKLRRLIRKATKGFSPEQRSAFQRGVGEGMAKAFVDSSQMWKLGPSKTGQEPVCLVTGPDGCFLEAKFDKMTDEKPCAEVAAEAFNKTAWRKVLSRISRRKIASPRLPVVCEGDVERARLEGELQGTIAAQKIFDPTIP